MSKQLQPLCNTLDSVLERLAAVECKLGLSPPSSNSPTHQSGSGSSSSNVVEDDGEVSPRLTAYDEHMKRALLPFTEACTALGPEMETIGTSINTVWTSIRTIVELGTKYKKPQKDNVPTSIQPYLKPCQDAMSLIQKSRLDMKFTNHQKAIMEMLACVSWVLMTPPPSPSTFVKDTIGASDFWANKVRKEYKGKGADGYMHIKFCDTMKALVLDLSGYLKEYHLSGLAWNPHGKDFSEATVGSVTASATAPKKEVSAPKKATPSGGGGGANIFAELKKKQTGAGDSAATGLKKVSRDQQTWRKEFKADKPVVAAPSKPATAAKPKFGSGAAKKPLGPPKCEYQDRGCKWNVENQTKDTCEGGVCKVEVTDVKQQVYIYKCENVTIQIIGKCKSVILDSCTKCGVVFDNLISACEVVNCKRVQVQATGSCPSFSIDKTDGIVVHLSNEAINESSFVTSKSSEMNVSWPDDAGEIKEAPIPEQFMHKMVNGSVTSQVSDLYH